MFWAEYVALYVAALAGIACVTPYSTELTAGALEKALERLHRPRWLILLLQSAQSAVLLGLATGLGLFIAHRVGLGAPLTEAVLAGKSPWRGALAMVAPALILGLGSAAVALLAEIAVFWPRLPPAVRDSFPIPALWKRALASLYGAVDEEILVRLFLLSLLALLIGLAWHGPGGSPTVGAFWFANVLAAIVFGLSHLPTTAALVRLTPLLVVRAIFLNGVIGVAAGYLFWRYGLEAAMLAHFSADIVLHVIGDSIAKAVREAAASTA